MASCRVVVAIAVWVILVLWALSYGLDLNLFDQGPRGQVEDNEVCSQLNALAMRPDVKTFLEIGTWYGGGSSLCIAKGLKATGPGKMLHTIEIFEECYTAAKQTLANYPVKCYLGSTVPVSDYSVPSVKDLHFKRYFDRDIELAKKYKPLLKTLCENYNFDAVFMDGGEWSGAAEFRLMQEVCKPKYILMHDTNKAKNEVTVAWLKGPEGKKEGWTIMKEGATAQSDKPDVLTGWALFRTPYSR